MNAEELRATTRAAIDVVEVLPDLLPLSERSLRRGLEPGGDLEHLALRVGRRVFIRVEPLRALLGLTPDMDGPGAHTPGTDTTDNPTGPGHDSASHIRAV